MQRLFLGAVLFLTIPFAEAQCPHSGPSFKPVLEELKKDSQAIFARFENLFPPKGLSTELLKTTAEDDRLIVPGVRAGRFRLGATLKEIRALTSIGTPTMKTDPRYEWILPLGYLPERKFLTLTDADVDLAFNQDDILTEIFIRDSAYHTENELKIGSPESSLARLRALMVVPRAVRGGIRYYQADGVTFIANRKAGVTEIVVLKLKGAAP